MGNYRLIAAQVNAAKVSDIIPVATSNWSSLPAWVQTQYNNGNLIFGNAYLIINGGDVAAFEDWLIQDSGGNLKSCNAADFTATYEAV